MDFGNYDNRKSIFFTTMYALCEITMMISTIYTYVSKKKLRDTLFLPACVGGIRLQLYLVHCIFYFYNLESLVSNEKDNERSI